MHFVYVSVKICDVTVIICFFSVLVMLDKFIISYCVFQYKNSSFGSCKQLKSTINVRYTVGVVDNVPLSSITTSVSG